MDRKVWRRIIACFYCRQNTCLALTITQDRLFQKSGDEDFVSLVSETLPNPNFLHSPQILNPFLFIFFLVSPLINRFSLIPVNPFTKNPRSIKRANDQLSLLFWPSMICCNLLSSSSKDLATKWVPVGWYELRSLVGFHCLITQSVVAQQAVALWLKTLLSTKRSPNLMPLASPPRFSTWTLFLAKKSSSWLDSLSTMGKISYLVTLGLQDLQETGLEQQQLSNLPNMIRNLLYKFY